MCVGVLDKRSLWIVNQVSKKSGRVGENGVVLVSYDVLFLFIFLG